MSRRGWWIGWLITTVFALNAVLLLWRRRLRLTSSTAEPIEPALPAKAAVPAQLEAETPIPIVVAAPTATQQRWPLSLDNTLFALAGLLFLATRLIGLERWPIYFFSDEAMNPLLAAQFLRNGFTDGAGQIFPTYFPNGTYLSLSVTVYAQVIPYLLFGFSVFVTRAVSVLVAFSGTLAIGLILKDSFKLRFWWLGTLILALVPAWFLHSRTAFEHVMWVGFYAWFLYFYLRYRQGQPRQILSAFVFGALAFYSYSGAQLGIGLTGILLLISDARYHWRTFRAQPKLLLAAALVALLLAAPYLRSTLDHGDETFRHLRILNSYWTQSISLGEKLDRLQQEYRFGLSPDYWFAPENDRDLIRHQMKGYGLLLPVMLPFLLLGLLICLKNFKHSRYRVVLITLLIAPVGGVLVSTLILRVLIMVIPAALLTSLGLIAVLTWLAQRVPYRPLALGVFAIVGALNLFMLFDALTNGPTWYTNYGLYGLQYGGQQVFGAARDELRRAPQTEVLVSPNWANGTNTLQNFFVPDDQRVQMINIDAYQFSPLPLTDDTLLVMTPAEYAETIADPKFTDIRVERTLPYPDGQPGFYLVRLKYSPEAPAIFAAEDAARRQPVSETIALDGQPVTVSHSQFDIGQIANAFDGDSYTLARTLVDNPAIIEITFDEPRDLSGLALSTGTMDFAVTVTLTPADGNAPQVLSRDFIQAGPDPTVDIPFDPKPLGPIKTLRLEVLDRRTSGDSHIHLREIKLR
jgi:4-amino-4-deoxy-L-arabinose transferase-like glycosyltransferase